MLPTNYRQEFHGDGVWAVLTRDDNGGSLEVVIEAVANEWAANVREPLFAQLEILRQSFDASSHPTGPPTVLFSSNIRWAPFGKGRQTARVTLPSALTLDLLQNCYLRFHRCATNVSGATISGQADS